MIYQDVHSGSKIDLFRTVRVLCISKKLICGSEKGLMESLCLNSEMVTYSLEKITSRSEKGFLMLRKGSLGL